MADHTHIEWTDATWNPITGCSVVSPGCKHCYAMKLAGGRMQHHPSRAGLTVDSAAGPVWNGEVRFNETWLLDPVRWTRPRKIFVCAHGDLFHESAPDAWIDRVFGVMAAASQHVYQVLTKRSDRMRAYLGADPYDLLHRWVGAANAVRPTASVSVPLPHVWLGVSVEDQRRARERLPDLIHTPAAVRWVSAEPLLSRVYLGLWLPQIQWVVVGGESGPDSRPMPPKAARQIERDCAHHGTAFLFKQWGDWHPMGEPLADGNINCMDKGERPDKFKRLEGDFMVRVGKRDAGRFLGGALHDGYPIGALGGQ